MLNLSLEFVLGHDRLNCHERRDIFLVVIFRTFHRALGCLTMSSFDPYVVLNGGGGLLPHQLF